MENQNEMEIDLVDLFFYLLKRMWVIVLALVVAAVAGFAVNSFFVAPQYTASTRVCVLSRSSEESVVYSDFQLSTQLFNDYKVLITGQNVTRQVIEKLGLDMSDSTLSNKIKVSAPTTDTTTRVLQISVTDTDPQRAADIANKVREVATEQLAELMNLDAVKTVYEADVPQSASSPNVVRNTVLCALLGTVAAICVLVVVYLLDDSIRTEEDVERYLGLGTLGVIPISTELNTSADKNIRNRRPSSTQANQKK